jgi:hypothetical protein
MAHFECLYCIIILQYTVLNINLKFYSNFYRRSWHKFCTVFRSVRRPIIHLFYKSMRQFRWLFCEHNKQPSHIYIYIYIYICTQQFLKNSVLSKRQNGCRLNLPFHQLRNNRKLTSLSLRPGRIWDLPLSAISRTVQWQSGTDV